MSNKESADDAAFSKALGDEIRSERGRHDWTQERVYTAAGMSKSAYMKLENGQAGTARKLSDVRRVAGVLGLRSSELMARAERTYRERHDADGMDNPT